MRFVHAKVYRFFTQNPKREYYFVGSPNLTSKAHQAGGNVETGFFVDVVPEKRPDFWLVVDQRKPLQFDHKTEDEGLDAYATSSLTLRHHWDRHVTEAFWDAGSASPSLVIRSIRGQEIGSIGPLEPGDWVQLDALFAQQIESSLRECSLFEVIGDGDRPGLLLVQEEGMTHKPSILMDLSAADILRYWSLLTPDQRSAFLEARAPEIALLSGGEDLVTRAKLSLEHDTLFDRFAGFFHAFACLERAVRDDLGEKNEKAAVSRLFGKKYDSLGSLLGRVMSIEGPDAWDDVDKHVIILCARQLCRELGRDFSDFWRDHREDVRALEESLALASAVRDRLTAADPEGMPPFLEWFEERFLRRAQPVEAKS
jgi:hypothetical protein